MTSHLELSVVIPTFNESELIAQVIESAFKELDVIDAASEIVVVDDSRDNTLRTLIKLAKGKSNLRVFHRTNARGVGSAIRLGLEKAVGKYVIIFMADAPHDTRHFGPIFRKLKQGYQLVSTSRFLPGSRFIGYPVPKRIGNLLCNLTIRVAFLRMDLGDFTTLFKGFERESILQLNLQADGFDLGAEIEMKALRKKYTVTEVPVDWIQRRAGSSKLALMEQAPMYIKRIANVWITYR